MPKVYSTPEWRRLVTDVRDRDGTMVNFGCPHVPEISNVAAPVRTPSGEVVASVSARVLDGRRLSSMVPAVERTARLVTANLARLAVIAPAHRGGRG
ncbi:hypothetical protein EV193_101149 [Herbihabitans rhizosphaerae]|uniref:Transcriptional regulator n=1 Tax=Herbihabitans rhizosphaerae TaxID=1872711 RepID=A0A4Q7L4V8_9PSEU|nr:hypothetical protein [Herbihabitans rhizosphaerae]RZS44274.1 hypothetical protein EV193_101149 [Herbihabitans rhizosphaerae]